MTLDATDLRILQLLQENAQLTIKEISKQINLSMTPTHDRIKRLEQEEIIEKYVTILNKKNWEIRSLFIVASLWINSKKIILRNLRKPSSNFLK